MVRGRAKGGKGSLCPPLTPPPPNTPNRPTWTPPPPHHHPELPHLDPPPPTDPPRAPPPSPSYTPPHSPSLNPPLRCPPPPPPPQGASGQQLVGGVVGVQNRGVAPPPPPPWLNLGSCALPAGGSFPPAHAVQGPDAAEQAGSFFLRQLAFPLVLLAGLFLIVRNSNQGGPMGGPGMGLGKTKARFEMEPETGVKFDDVAGVLICVGGCPCTTCVHGPAHTTVTLFACGAGCSFFPAEGGTSGTAPQENHQLS